MYSGDWVDLCGSEFCYRSVLFVRQSANSAVRLHLTSFDNACPANHHWVWSTRLAGLGLRVLLPGRENGLYRTDKRAWSGLPLESCRIRWLLLLLRVRLRKHSDQPFPSSIGLRQE